MEKKFNFVYVVTNLINGKQYVGDHSTNNLECSKTKKYLGSGIYILNALLKYGNENFKREILEFFPTKQQAFDAQEKYIIQFNTLISNGYNISPKGGINVVGGCSIETRRRIGLKHKGKIISEEQRRLISIALKGRIKSDEERKNLSKSLMEHKLSEETKNKIREKHKGKKVSEETKNKISQSTKGIKTIPEETRKKMSEARKKYWETKRNNI